MLFVKTPPFFVWRVPRYYRFLWPRRHGKLKRPTLLREYYAKTVGSRRLSWSLMNENKQKTGSSVQFFFFFFYNTRTYFFFFIYAGHKPCPECSKRKTKMGGKKKTIHVNSNVITVGFLYRWRGELIFERPWPPPIGNKRYKSKNLG